tara:strand:- start:4256 stop:5221 length:966 start_codon:yes stop_codon:yes gene_type:complete
MKVFCFPFRYQNKIIQINNEVLESLDCDVFPLKSVYKLNNILDTKKIIVLNWIEDQPYLKSYGLVKSWIYFFYYIFTIIFCKITSEKIIWIKHNFNPHIKSSTAYRHLITCTLMRFLNIKETTLESYVGDAYIPHPLYLNDTELRGLAAKIEDSDKVKVAFFGHVKRYKGLHDALELWPKNISLQIYGELESASYKKELVSIIKRRNINVRIHDGFLTDVELERLLLSTSHVFLPHEANTMISSGSFYHAISYGCNILATKSEFSENKSRKHDFVNIYDLDKLQLSNLENTMLQRRYIISESLRCYSRSKLRNCWNAILKD